jgi:transposase
MSTNGKRKRPTFSDEFKRDAVNLVVVEGYTIAAAAKAVWNSPRKVDSESVLTTG